MQDFMKVLRHLANTDPDEFERLFLKMTNDAMETFPEPLKKRYEAAMWAAEMKNRKQNDPLLRVFATTKILQDLGSSIEEEEGDE